jgi:glycosyltransferase involved in cell wall biosynthesis
MLSVKASIRIRMAVNKASIIYLFNNRDRLFFARNKNSAVKTLLDTGTLLVPTREEKCSTSDRLRILWCGRLVPSKAPDLFLHVLASLGHWNDMISVQIIGDGYLLPELISYAKRMSITNIEWISHVEHEEVLRYMHNSDILVHTSYREATSSVIPEALSVGLPVICHDAFGMAIAIDETCGIKIPLCSFDSSLAGFRDAILSLLRNRDALVSLKRGALRRAQELSWDSKAMTIAKAYVEILKNENTPHK